MLHAFALRRCMLLHSAAVVHVARHASPNRCIHALMQLCHLHLMHSAAAMQDGKMLPGAKGLSMSEEQWAQLVNNMAVINQALGK
jgi:hypothetical protein